MNENRELLDNLADSLQSVDIARARAEMRKLVGEIDVIATPEEIRLEAKQGAVETTLLREAAGRQVLMVAGARFADYRRRIAVR